MRQATEQWVKFRFTSTRHGSTAGLVIPLTKLSSTTDLSRYFPYSEAMKMRRIEISGPYESWAQAFYHIFE